MSLDHLDLAGAGGGIQVPAGILHVRPHPGLFPQEKGNGSAGGGDGLDGWGGRMMARKSARGLAHYRTLRAVRGQLRSGVVVVLWRPKQIIQSLLTGGVALVKNKAIIAFGSSKQPDNPPLFNARRVTDPRSETWATRSRAAGWAATIILPWRKPQLCPTHKKGLTALGPSGR